MPLAVAGVLREARGTLGASTHSVEGIGFTKRDMFYVLAQARALCEAKLALEVGRTPQNFFFLPLKGQRESKTSVGIL